MTVGSADFVPEFGPLVRNRIVFPFLAFFLLPLFLPSSSFCLLFYFIAFVLLPVGSLVEFTSFSSSSSFFRVQTRRFGAATVDILAEILRAKVLPKKDGSRQGAFKMIHACAEAAKARECQRALEDKEENELLFETKLTKVKWLILPPACICGLE